jgi:hypothetical protein
MIAGMCVCEQLDGADLLEYLERMCDPKHLDGKWVTQYDMVESGDKINLVDTGKVGDGCAR